MQSDTASPKRGSPLPLFGCLFPRKKIPPSDAKPPDGIFFGDVSVDLLLDLGSLTDAVAQVVQLRTANLTDANDGNARNVRGMQGKVFSTPQPYVTRRTVKGLGNAAAVTGDDSTLINLNSLSVALFDLVLDANRVADAEGRHLSLELLVCKKP